jgi:hypothetical protein
MSIFSKFLDEYVNAADPVNTKFALMKGKVEAGFNGRVSVDGETKYHFEPINPKDGNPDVARMKAARFIDENGGESTSYNPYMAIRLTRFKGTSLTHDTSEWTSDEFSSVITGFKTLDSDTGTWVYVPNYDLMMASVFPNYSSVRYPNIKQAMDEDQFGKELYLVLKRAPDATFVKDDPLTHNDYNSQIINEGESDEVLIARYYQYVAQVFETREAAVSWLNEQGLELKGDAKLGGSVPNEKVSKINVPMPDEFAEADGWDADEWPEIHDELVASVIALGQNPSAKELRSLAKNEYDLPVTVIRAVAEHIAKEPAF